MICNLLIISKNERPCGVHQSEPSLAKIRPNKKRKCFLLHTYFQVKICNHPIGRSGES